MAVVPAIVVAIAIAIVVAIARACSRSGAARGASVGVEARAYRALDPIGVIPGGEGTASKGVVLGVKSCLTTTVVGYLLILFPCLGYAGQVLLHTTLGHPLLALGTVLTCLSAACVADLLALTRGLHPLGQGGVAGRIDACCSGLGRTVTAQQ
jgi:hypothetical protein